jgi:hypothetical protein
MSRYPRGLAAGFGVVLGLGLSSCDGTDHPTIPSPPPSTPNRSWVTLSGVVLDYTTNGPVPRANVPLLVRAWPSTGVLDPLRPAVFMEVTSDAAGRYSVSGVPVGGISITAAAGSGYYAPCPAGWDVVRSDRIFDVHVVSAALLSAAGAPADMPYSGGIWVSGVVFERTPQGRPPIAGATVTLEGHASDPRIGSTTLTDAAGRYHLCPPIPSTGTDTCGSVLASREGYRPASRSAFLGWDYTGIDIELSRP